MSNPATQSTPAVKQPIEPAASPPSPAPVPASTPAASAAHVMGKRRIAKIVGAAVLLLALIAAIPRILEAFQTVSTDDAYVNGHVTFVAPRVAGQVARVLVDDNN